MLPQRLTLDANYLDVRWMAGLADPILVPQPQLADLFRQMLLEKIERQ
jgi:hypothetical protein